jgi:hypothetical protein
MNQLVRVPSGSPLPALVAAAGDRASMRFLEFFAANMRNPHTRRAYARAADEFLAWCATASVPSIGAVQPVHVATRSTGLSPARWCRSTRPARCGPRHVVTCGQTPVFDPLEALLDSIETSTVIGLRDAP